MKTYYYLYKITNLVNAKIYVGVHKTQNLDDGYMGSGKVINRAIEKHGIENFRKDILEFFDTAEAMYAREKEIVTDEFLLREDVYNLRRGGHGGFDFINANQLSHVFTIEDSKKGWSTVNKILEQKYGQEWKKAFSVAGTNKLKELRETDPEINRKILEGSRKGREAALSDAARAKRKETFKKNKHQQGENHNGFGTCWIYHELVGNKKCKKDMLPLYIEQGWVKGRFYLKKSNIKD